MRSRPTRFGRQRPRGATIPKMQLSPLIVGYELVEGRLQVIFAWIDVAAVDSTNGVRLAMVPSTLIYTISAN